MKKILFLLLAGSLFGCRLFSESIGKAQSPPKSVRFTIDGTFIKKEADDYYLFSKLLCNSVKPPQVYHDTLTVNGELYHQVFFAKIISKNLDKDYRNMNFTFCAGTNYIYSKGDSVRKEIPGYGSRKFKVLEDMVGVE